MDEQARQKRNAYYRAWRKRNKEKVKEYNERYWLKRSAGEETCTKSNLQSVE